MSSVVQLLSSSSATLSSSYQGVWLEVVRCGATAISAMCALVSIFLTIRLKKKDSLNSKVLFYEKRFLKSVIDYSVEQLEFFRNNFGKLVEEANFLLASQTQVDLQRKLLREEIPKLQSSFYKFKSVVNYRLRAYKSKKVNFDSAKIWEKCDNLLSSDLFSIEKNHFCEKRVESLFQELESVILNFNDFNQFSA